MLEGKENNNNNNNDANEAIIVKNQIKPEESNTDKLSENNLPQEQDKKIETLIIKVNQNNQNNQNIQNNIEENNLKTSERFVTKEKDQKEINKNNNNNEISQINRIKLEIEKQGNTFTLNKEIINEINLAPCEICKCPDYYIYIPRSFNTNFINENYNTNNALFPLVICENEHQYCFICRQQPHPNKICEQNYLDSILINQYFNSLIKITPEEKISIINDMKTFAIENSYNPPQKSCCNCGYVCCVFSVIFLILIYTFVSLLLINIAILCILASLAFRILSCCCHCCYAICCIQDSYHDEDKGSYILRTIYVNESARNANYNSCCEIDDVLGKFGCGAAACVCSLIPKGYKKICECLD